LDVISKAGTEHLLLSRLRSFFNCVLSPPSDPKQPLPTNLGHRGAALLIMLEPGSRQAKMHDTINPPGSSATRLRRNRSKVPAIRRSRRFAVGDAPSLAYVQKVRCTDRFLFPASFSAVPSLNQNQSRALHKSRLLPLPGTSRNLPPLHQVTTNRT